MRGVCHAERCHHPNLASLNAYRKISFWPWPHGMWDRSSLTGDQTCATCTSCQAGDTQETQVQPLGQEDPLEKGMATHCSILAWEIPWTEEPGGLHSKESQTDGHAWATTWQLLSWMLGVVPTGSPRKSLKFLDKSSFLYIRNLSSGNSGSTMGISNVDSM